MSEPSSITWVRFEGDSQIGDFMNAAVQLHQPILDRLSDDQRPFFHDYWLRTFNDSLTFLGMIDGEPHALISQPSHSDIHQYRWRTSSLACSDDVFGELILPKEIALNQAFMLSSCRVGSAIPGTRAVEKQLGYARSLSDVSDSPLDNETWQIEALTHEDLEETLALMKRGYAVEEGDALNLVEQRTELSQILEHDAGWCWIARSPDDGTIRGVVSYIANHIPLAGVPAILVADLVVDPRNQGRGIATHLQRFAYRELREQGLALVFGNIDPQNKASRRQAELLERSIWYRAIVF